MSRFARDALHYGDRLVYEALLGKWSRYHERCGCGLDWIEAHVMPAGFSVVRRRPGFVALVGPGLTEGVDEGRLSANPLWTAVTGSQGTDDRVERVQVFPRTADELDRAVRRRQRSDGPRHQARRGEARPEPITEPQRRYLISLASRVSREVFDGAYRIATDQSGREPRQSGEKSVEMVARLTKASARRLITVLKDT